MMHVPKVLQHSALNIPSSCCTTVVNQTITTGFLSTPVVNYFLSLQVPIAIGLHRIARFLYSSFPDAG